MTQFEPQPERSLGTAHSHSERNVTPLQHGDTRLEPHRSSIESIKPVFETTSAAPPGGSDSSEVTGDPAIEVDPHRTRQGTFELKFLVDTRRAMEIMAWARNHLDPDPHADPHYGDGYRVNSLYLDTPQFDVFHRMDGFRQQKFRLRRYGQESLVWFEQKRKRKGLVRKRRVPVGESEISARLSQPVSPDWDGIWFRNRLDEQGLRPVCQVTYERFARVKFTDQGTLRLTIDGGLTACPAEGWTIPAGPIDGVALLDEKRILELKFRGAMPLLFRNLVEQQQLQVTPFSKYRTSVEECIPLDVHTGNIRFNTGKTAPGETKGELSDA